MELAFVIIRTAKNEETFDSISDDLCVAFSKDEIIHIFEQISESEHLCIRREKEFYFLQADDEKTHIIFYFPSDCTSYKTIEFETRGKEFNHVFAKLQNKLNARIFCMYTSQWYDDNPFCFEQWNKHNDKIIHSLNKLNRL